MKPKTTFNFIVLLVFFFCLAKTTHGKDANQQFIETTTVEDSLPARDQIHTLSVKLYGRLHTLFSSMDKHEISNLINNILTKNEIFQSQCFNETAEIFESLALNKPGAFQFFDSVGKLPSGFSYGALVWLGSYEMCMRSSILVSNETTIQGKYCLLPFYSNLLANSFFGTISPISIGTCFPKSCDSQQVSNITNTILYELQFEILKIPVNDSFFVLSNQTQCKTPLDELSWTPQAIVMITILSIFGILILTSTAHDIWLNELFPKNNHYQPSPNVISIEAEAQETNGEIINVNENEDTNKLISIPPDNEQPSNRIKETFVNVWLCFSMYRNAPKIWSMQQQSGTLTCVQGIRFISMTWVILGHTYSFVLGMVSNIGQLYFDWINSWTFEAIINATVSVDSFFVLSGFLSTYLFFRELKKLGGSLNKINWLMYYVHRYWRLTPPYLLVMGTYVTLIRYLYDGPIYNQSPSSDNSCTHSWWRNALYINNLFPMSNSDFSCMGWSWYLANDMQFYVISPIFIVLLYWKAPIGIGAISGIILASVTALGIHNTVNKIPIGLQGLAANDEFDVVYIKPWFRIPAYLIGMLGGYILHYLESKKPKQSSDNVEHQNKVNKKDTPCFKLKWYWNLLGWSIAATLCLLVIYSTYNVNAGKVKISQELMSLYGCTFRIAWSLGLTWVIVACITGNGGFVNTFLSAPIFAPLSRLTYCAYLVHPVVIMFYMSSRRSVDAWDTLTVVYTFLGHVVLSYGLAFITSLTFESPLIGTEKVLRSL